jgi:hypothetical protein
MQMCNRGHALGIQTLLGKALVSKMQIDAQQDRTHDLKNEATPSAEFEFFAFRSNRSCQKCLGLHNPHTCKNNSLREPHYIRAVGRLREKWPNGEKFWPEPWSRRAEGCLGSPRILWFFATSNRERENSG